MIAPKALRWIYFITAVGMVATGVGFLVGPDSWQSSPGYVVTRKIMPIDVWACLFVLVGVDKVVAYIVRSRAWLRAGAAMGGTLCLGWGMALVGAAVQQALNGWGAVPMWFVVAGVQLAGAASWDASGRRR